jgi:methionyl-tRNA formyltransferase
MRLVFFGTPDFASKCLEKIMSSKHEVLAVVTAPDKPKGRGMKVEPSDVKRLAQSRGLDILQPQDLREPIFVRQLSSFSADLFCVVAFRILPDEVFSIPTMGCINLHGSLLPKYRGAAPINWVLINGENETGLTTFFIRRKVDTGDILLQEKIDIGPEETFGELYERMAGLGGDLLIKTIDWIESGQFKTISQDNSLISAAPKITPELGNIDWTQTNTKVHNLIRGLSPKPGAFSFHNGKKIIILRSKPINDMQSNAAPGMVVQADPNRGIMVACGEGTLEIMELKPESGKKITGAEYVRGHKCTIGEKFERNFGK